MALVILGWVVVSGFLVVQTIYVISTGQTMLFLVKPEHRHAPVGPLSRLIYALVYLFPSVGMIVILVGALKRHGLEPVRMWLHGNFGMLFYILLLAASGLLCLIQPVRMLRWTLRNNPEVANTRAGVMTARLIGLAVLLVSLFILAKL